MSFRLAWTALFGGLLILIGSVGLIGTLFGYRPAFPDIGGFPGLAFGVLLDVVYLAAGMVLVRWGWRTRRSGRLWLRQLMDWLDKQSHRIGANSAWRQYERSKARLMAAGLSALSALVFWGTLMILTSNAGKALVMAAPLWAASSIFLGGLTVDPTKAFKWWVILFPFVVIITVVLEIAVGVYP